MYTWKPKIGMTVQYLLDKTGRPYWNYSHPSIHGKGEYGTGKIVVMSSLEEAFKVEYSPGKFWWFPAPGSETYLQYPSTMPAGD